MTHTHYLIVGASHAALSALHAIRLHDAEQEVTLLTRDDSLPYSPRSCPMWSRAAPTQAACSCATSAYFAEHKVDYLRGAAVRKVNAGRSAVELADGSKIGFDKLLLATGAAPMLPPFPACRDQVPCAAHLSRRDRIARSAAAHQARAGAGRRPDRHARGGESRQGRRASKRGGTAAARARRLLRRGSVRHDRTGFRQPKACACCWAQAWRHSPRAKAAAPRWATARKSTRTCCWSPPASRR